MGDAVEKSDSDYESELSDQEIVDSEEVEDDSKSLFDRFRKVVDNYRELAELMISASNRFNSKVEVSDDEIDMSDSIVALFGEDTLNLP